jgi:adenine-specific DNA-methyltransferase
MAHTTFPFESKTEHLVAPVSTETSVLGFADLMRHTASQNGHRRNKAALGQFFTPVPVACLMASMLQAASDDVHILDAGAGVGVLFAACIEELTRRDLKPTRITVTAYEVDEELIGSLDQTMALCRQACERAGVAFVGQAVCGNFLESAVTQLMGGLFDAGEHLRFNCAILNPPYRKIRSESRERKLLRHLGIETSNLYTGFIGAAIKLLEPGGDLVAIAPRSFCNGPYFRPFRKLLLSEMRLHCLHLFESRELAFKDDEVLQENIILHAMKTSRGENSVLVTTSAGPGDEYFSSRELAYTQVVRPDDPQAFIHVVPDELEQGIAERMARLPATLDTLGLRVSTGRVVDFRARDYLRQSPGVDTAPLVYPAHIRDGAVIWPRPEIRKPNALAVTPRTTELLVPNDYYVLVKRFSSKEERRRVTAAVYDPATIPCAAVGFENHLNYFHHNGGGLDPILAWGLSAFLNSTLVDAYIRQFNGHTQVNATDLRSIPYPSVSQLIALGRKVDSGLPSQDALDRAVKEELFGMSDGQALDPVQAKRRIEEAQAVLKALGMPTAQHNERSALTLLALLDLKSDTPWANANNPLRGITPMMDFFREHYGKQYVPNTHETVRRATVHQFVEAALAVANPDNPNRPTNSGQTVYQIEASTLDLLRHFGAVDWDDRLRDYLAQTGTLKERYARARQLARIPVQVRPGLTLRLTPGGQNPLVAHVIEDFGPLFTHGGVCLYVGDTGEKFPFLDREGLAELGVSIEPHGKMPDLIIYDKEQNRLILIEAVSSHGPISPKRRAELERLFSSATAMLVFVTAFPDRKKMASYLPELDWDTEAWAADSPEHLIHFNGDRFLAPGETLDEEK